MINPNLFRLIYKNKEIEASSKTSIGDLIKDEIEESSTKKDEEV